MTQLGAILLPVLPLLALLAALLLGRYPGCEAIIRLSERIAATRAPRRAGAEPGLPLAPRAFVPTGGLLLAYSLSGRAPPLRLTH